MTTDRSSDFNDTREFLDRRFRDVQIVGGTMESMVQWAGFTAHAGLNVLRSKGVGI
jgi:ubiquinone biosynthesis protein COQ9